VQCYLPRLTPLSFTITLRHPISTRFPYTTLFRSYRDVETSQSALDRTERQKAFLSAFAGKAREVAADDASLVTDIYETLDDYMRSEEHTSELQSRFDLVCRLLLEKKNHKDE